MPSSQGFDPSSVRERLRSWLAAQLPDAENVEVSNLDAPSATGHSSETVLFDVSWTEAGSPHHDSLVLRTAPADGGQDIFCGEIPQGT